MPILRLLIVVAIVYFFYKMVTWLPQAMSNTILCPNCDGKGHWYGVRHREECKTCQGSGRLPKGR